METFILCQLSSKDGESVYDMLQRIGPSENAFKNEVNGMTYNQYQEWLKKMDAWSRGDQLPKGYVKQWTYWLMVNTVPVGYGKLRERVTEASRKFGGNIGYAIDPLHRGKGYGKKLFELLLQEAKNKQIPEVFSTVEKFNYSSKKVHERCGGQLIKEDNVRWYFLFSLEEEKSKMLNFTVGPVMSKPDILDIANHSTPYFRTPEFSKLMKENEKLMLEFLHAPAGSRCVFLTSSGTGAMESLVMNIINNQDKVIVINGGSFGRRFVELCQLHKRNFTEVKCEFGRQLQPEQLERLSNYTALLINMHETSSGVLYDMKMVAQFCKKNHILLLVDAISAFIADEINMEELGAAAVITGSQKALAVQPGVAIVALSSAALQRVEKNEEVCMYLSLKQALINGERGQTPFTPAVITLLQINKRLKSIKESGGIATERNVIASIAKDFRNNVKDLPFKFVSESPSNAVTALHPVNVGAKEIIRILKDEYNIWGCPNGGEMADSVFRIGHIGHITHEDLHKLIDALHDMNERGLL